MHITSLDQVPPNVTSDLGKPNRHIGLGQRLFGLIILEPRGKCPDRVCTIEIMSRTRSLRRPTPQIQIRLSRVSEANQQSRAR